MAERLNPADHVLAHGIGALVSRRLHDWPREQMLIDVVRSALPDANRNNPRMEALIALAYKVEDCASLGHGRTLWMLDASDAYAAFCEWRLGLAQEAWRKVGQGA